MVKMYDFGADTSNIGVNERKALAWPVAVWSCYIPESDSHELNILEHLILQLVDKGYKDPKSVLCSQVGFNKDLVNAAIEACIDKDYFDRRYKELTLSVDGKSVLGTFDNPYSSDLEASKKSKKIYMIQDLVTKSVIPVFDIDKLPQFYLEDENAIEIRYENFTGSKPRSASVKTAMRYWARLCHNIRRGLITGNNIIDVSQPLEKKEDVEDFIPFEDEVDWEDVRADGSVREEEVRTLADKEAEDEQQKADEDIKNLTILDDNPEMYWARGFVAINKNAPDEAMIISPFGERLNDWFRTVINRLRTCDSDFEEEIQLFLMLKRDELKDVIALENYMNISIFDRFPFICNDAKYADLKRAIEAFYRTKIRINSGEDETHNYTENRATALQIALRHLLDKNKELFQPKLQYSDYEIAINGLVNSYGLSTDIIRNYLSNDRSIYSHVLKCKEGNGHITGYSALILIDAWNNKNGKSMDLLKAFPEFPEVIYEITRPRNVSTHGNAGKNGRAGYADMYISDSDANKGYESFEKLIVALYSRFMEV